MIIKTLFNKKNVIISSIFITVCTTVIFIFIINLYNKNSDNNSQVNIYDDESIESALDKENIESNTRTDLLSSDNKTIIDESNNNITDNNEVKTVANSTTESNNDNNNKVDNNNINNNNNSNSNIINKNESNNNKNINNSNNTNNNNNNNNNTNNNTTSTTNNIVKKQENKFVRFEINQGMITNLQSIIQKSLPKEFNENGGKIIVNSAPFDNGKNYFTYTRFNPSTVANRTFGNIIIYAIDEIWNNGNDYVFQTRCYIDYTYD